MTSVMSEFDLCDVPALFNIILMTNKHHNLMRFKYLMALHTQGSVGRLGLNGKMVYSMIMMIYSPHPHHESVFQ